MPAQKLLFDDTAVTDNEPVPPFTWMIDSGPLPQALTPYTLIKPPIESNAIVLILFEVEEPDHVFGIDHTYDDAFAAGAILNVKLPEQEPPDVLILPTADGRGFINEEIILLVAMGAERHALLVEVKTQEIASELFKLDDEK